MRILIASILCSLFITYSYGQIEICNNGIDDDDDGLIDCFDDDCCKQGDCIDFWFDSCIDEDCLFKGSENFTISRRTITSENQFQDFSNIIAGDLNGDGVTEIITTLNNKTVIVDPVTENIIYTPNSQTVGFDAYSMGDIVSSSPGVEILINTGFSIRAVDYQGNPLYSINNSDISQVLNLTDFDQDGRAEFHTESVIYDGETGAILLDLPEIPVQLAASSASIAVDVLDDSYCSICDGLELVAAGFIYAIDIPSRTYVIQKDYRFEHSTGVYFSAVVDWDLDGDLDLFTMSFSDIIILDITTNSILYSTSKNNVQNGIINIGNLDDDPYPEFSYITDENLGTLYAFDNDLSLMWSKLVNDNSGFTGLSLFDFDANGQSEIVYRDEDNLRIINAATGNDIQLVPCSSPTGGEFPIILDYDQDQEAEIISICDGELTIFSSGTGSPWADCRSVWNQRHFFNVHIEEDLSIPAVQQWHHLPGKLGLNSFLNQYQVPELIDIDLRIDNILLNSGCNEVVITICNDGNENLNANFPISIYSDDPSMSNTVLIESVLAPMIAGGNCIDFNYIPNTGYTGPIWFLLNDSGLTPPQIFLEELPNTSLAECDFVNNIDSITILPCNNPEICNNGIDDDNDGAIDCDDSDCLNLALDLLENPICGSIELTICNNGGSTILDNIPISLYESNSNIALSLIQTQELNVNLQIGACQSFIISISSQYEGDIIASINDLGVNTLPIDLNTNGSNREINECLFHDNWAELTISLSSILLDLDSQVRVCKQSQYTIIPQNGYASYTWDGVLLQQNYTVTNSGIYTLEVTDDCGQSSADQIEIIFDQEKVSTEILRICQGDSSLQQGQWIRWDDQDVEIRKSFPIECDSIYFYEIETLTPTSFSFSETICNNDSFHYASLDSFLLADTNYEFIFSNSQGCDSLLNISIISIPLLYNLTSFKSCSGMADGSIELDFSDPNLISSIQWSTGDNQVTSLYGLAPGYFTVNITDLQGCSYRDSIAVEEFTNNNFEIIFEDATCDYEVGQITIVDHPEIQSITLNGTLIPSDETQHILSGNSELSITDLSGCEYDNTFSVSEYIAPMVDYPDTIYVENLQDQEIIPSLRGDYIYNWSDTTLLTCSDCDQPTINTNADILLSLKATTLEGCDTTLFINIIVIPEAQEAVEMYIPNAFNPTSNNDANGGFRIFIKDNNMVPIDLKIYDRWGNFIYGYTGDSKDLYWDGSYKGKALNPGVFSYILTYDNGDKILGKTGTIALIR